MASDGQMEVERNSVTVTQNPIRSYYALFGTTITTVKEQANVPAAFTLEQNYPNPFNPETMIRYNLRIGGHLKLCVFNLVGEQVATLVNTEQPAGNYSVRWGGVNEAADSLPSGMYFYRLELAGMTRTRVMIMMK